MGKKDLATKTYMSDNERFADAFNAYLFDGKQVIRADGLRECDPTEMVSLMSSVKDSATEKVRDLLKCVSVMTDGKRTYLILGIENQSNVNQAMPVRNNLYDALEYGRQVTQIASEHRKKKEWGDDPGEFLSGFHRDDKLKPVITLAIYWGSGHWDGPRSLHEMFELEDEEILRYVNDYRLHVIVPEEIEDFDKYQTELGTVMKFISVSADKEKMMNLWDDECFREISSEAVELLNACTGTKFEVNEEEDKVDLCKGIADLIKESEERGEKRAEARKFIEHINHILENSQGLDLNGALNLLGETMEAYEAAKLLVGDV